MRKFLTALTALSALSLLTLSPAEAFNDGCYREGMSGYHWYRFCAGFHHLYPHHRVCRNGRCWYH